MNLEKGCCLKLRIVDMEGDFVSTDGDVDSLPRIFVGLARSTAGRRARVHLEGRRYGDRRTG